MSCEIPRKITRNSNVPDSQQLADFACIFRKLPEDPGCQQRECLGQNCLQKIIHMLVILMFRSIGCKALMHFVVDRKQCQRKIVINMSVQPGRANCMR